MKGPIRLGLVIGAFLFMGSAPRLVAENIPEDIPEDPGPRPELRGAGLTLTEDVPYVQVEDRRGLLSFLMPNRTIPNHAVGMKYDLLPIPDIAYVGSCFRALMLSRGFTETLNISYWQEWRVGESPWRLHLLRIEAISPGNCSSLAPQEMRVGFAFARKF